MSDKLPEAHVARRGRRRLRLRFVERRDDEGFLNWLVVQLSALPDVTQVRADPLTGSILILHSGDPAAILESAAGAGQFVIAGDEHGSKPLLDREAARLAVPLAAAGILSAFAVWQLLRGRVLPPAVTLGWYAATLALPLLLAETKKE